MRNRIRANDTSQGGGFVPSSLKIATYNIHACVGRDACADPQRIIQVLRELNADILALQEVGGESGTNLSLLQHLAAETGLQPIADTATRRGARHFGNALLTRLPVLTVNRVDLSWPHREPRGALEVTLDWRGLCIHTIATHLGLMPAERREQVRCLLGLFEARKADVSILLGDLNEWLLWGRTLRWLRRHFPPTPHLRTFPACLPLFALDRIWVEPRTALVNIQVHDSPAARLASDHLPLKAELTREGFAATSHAAGEQNQSRCSV